MSRKKVLVVLDKLSIGGIEKSIISYLNAMNSNNFEISLRLTQKGGVYEKYIPEWVNVNYILFSEFGINIQEKGIRKSLLFFLKKLRINYFSRLCYLILVEVFFIKKSHRKLYYFENSIEMKDETLYDIAIAYHNIEQALYVGKYINASHKLSWFHTELTTLEYKPIVFSEIYSNFQYFISSSLAVKNELLEMNFNSTEIKNVPYLLSKSLAQNMSNEVNVSHFKKNILTVGRLTHQKGFDIASLVCKKLNEAQLNFEWMIIGEGNEEENLKELIKTHQLDNFVLLGAVENPYPYFSSCDIYVQPSRYEGYCITLAEARVFNKPSVVTDFAGAREQIIHEKTGFIVNTEVEAIFQAIKKLLTDQECYENMVKNLQNKELNKINEENKFEELLNTLVYES